MIRLGYACINSTLSETHNICCNKTCRLNTAISKGENSGYPQNSKKYSRAIYDFLVDISIKNLEAVYKILSWSKNNKILFYRLSSGMFPHIANEKIRNHLTEEDWNNYNNLIFAYDIIFDMGKYAQKYGIRLTMHPDHFNQLASENLEVVKNTFSDLSWHAKLLDLLEQGAESYILYSKQKESNYNKENILKHGILCVHGGGTYGDKKSALERWKNNFKKLPENIKRRICLENCEKGYCVEDLLPICQELSIPLIFDFHHYACWKNYHPENGYQKDIRSLLPLILKTWGKIIPKFHLSDQAENKK